jgi:cytochrome c oxidase subunit Vb
LARADTSIATHTDASVHFGGCRRLHARQLDCPEANWSHTTEIKTEDDLRGPGAAPGTVPTDLEQSTGLERLEILGKMEGVDIFDMRPLDASRTGMD